MRINNQRYILTNKESHELNNNINNNSNNNKTHIQLEMVTNAKQSNHKLSKQ